MVEYFLVKIGSIRIESIEEMLDLLEKALKMFHSNHYVVTRLRINLSMAYLELASRMGLEPHKVPAELHLKRKEFLDEVHKVVEAVEPGLSRRRGKRMRVFALNYQLTQKPLSQDCPSLRSPPAIFKLGGFQKLSKNF